MKLNPIFLWIPLKCCRLKSHHVMIQNLRSCSFELFFSLFQTMGLFTTVFKRGEYLWWRSAPLKKTPLISSGTWSVWYGTLLPLLGNWDMSLSYTHSCHFKIRKCKSTIFFFFFLLLHLFFFWGGGECNISL